MEVSTPVALVDFAADDQMPQLVQDYYAHDTRNDSFSNSRLVLQDEENMQFDGQKRRVARLSAGTDNQHYDPIDVATVITVVGPGSIQNGVERVAESSDDDPIEIGTGNGSGVPTGLGRDEDSYLYEHCHAPMPDTSNKRAQKQLMIACCVSVLFMIAEVVGKDSGYMHDYYN